MKLKWKFQQDVSSLSNFIKSKWGQIMIHKKIINDEFVKDRNSSSISFIFLKMVISRKIMNKIKIEQEIVILQSCEFFLTEYNRFRNLNMNFKSIL